MTTTEGINRSYYCSMKFRHLKIDLKSGTTYNCHAAMPHAVDFGWLEKNKGNLFNTPTSVTERNMMLLNQRNTSCEQNCWKAEDVESISPRLRQGGTTKTHTNTITQPEILDITIGNDCNLTCSYCCKEYSSAWGRDLQSNGEYGLNSERYQLTNKDKLLMKFSQSEFKQSSRYQSLLNEIRLAAPTLKELIITGGEPFLDNRLIDTLVDLPLSSECKIEVFTGLGVGITRFKKILSKLKLLPNLHLSVSAECTDKFYEFNRYGNSWLDFQDKLKLIRDHGIRYEFHSTLSNLTIFGFAEFAKKFKDDEIVITFAYQPDMMAPYIIDTTSKQDIIKQLQCFPDPIKNTVIQSLAADATESQRKGIKQFLIEFVRRRPDLDITIYPKHFLNWIDYVV